MDWLQFFSSLAWPVVVLFSVIWLSVRHRSTVDRLFDRTKKVSFPGGFVAEMDPVGQIQQALVPKALEEIKEADKETEPEKRQEIIRNVLDEVSSKAAVSGGFATAEMVSGRRPHSHLGQFILDLPRGADWQAEMQAVTKSLDETVERLKAEAAAFQPDDGE